MYKQDITWPCDLHRTVRNNYNIYINFCYSWCTPTRVVCSIMHECSSHIHHKAEVVMGNIRSIPLNFTIPWYHICIISIHIRRSNSYSTLSLFSLLLAFCEMVVHTYCESYGLYGFCTTNGELFHFHYDLISYALGQKNH